MLRAFVCLFALLGVLPSCGDKADGCWPKPLDEFCRGACPADKAEAVDHVCPDWGTNPEWSDAPNGCGGTTVRSGANYTGVVYVFDGAEKLIGAQQWSDVNDFECNSFTETYGKECEPTAKFTEHECPKQLNAANGS